MQDKQASKTDREAVQRAKGVLQQLPGLNAPGPSAFMPTEVLAIVAGVLAGVAGTLLAYYLKSRTKRGGSPWWMLLWSVLFLLVAIGMIILSLKLVQRSGGSSNIYITTVKEQ